MPCVAALPPCQLTPLCAARQTISPNTNLRCRHAGFVYLGYSRSIPQEVLQVSSYLFGKKEFARDLCGNITEGSCQLLAINFQLLIQDHDLLELDDNLQSSA